MWAGGTVIKAPAHIGCGNQFYQNACICYL
jgi:hypothetical protein